MFFQAERATPQRLVENTSPDKPMRTRPRLRWLATTLTRIRDTGTNLIATEVVSRGPNFRSVGLAARYALFRSTDFLDGPIARASGILTPSDDADDRQTDYRGYRKMMQAMFLASGDPRYAGYLAANDARNGIVDPLRTELVDAGHADAGKARLPGKMKAIFQDVAVTTDLLPIGEMYSHVVHAMHAGSIALAGWSGYDIWRNAQHLLHNESNVQTIEPAVEASDQVA